MGSERVLQNSDRARPGRSSPPERKTNSYQTTAHDVLQALVVCLHLTTYYSLHTMSDASSYRAQVLARRAALEALSSKAQAQPVADEPALVQDAYKPGTASVTKGDDSSPADAKPAKRQRSTRGAASVSAPAPEPSSASAPAPAPTPDTPTVISPTPNWPFTVSCSFGHVSNYLFSPDGTASGVLKQYYSSSPHLHGILRHCGFTIEGPDGKVPTQAQLRFYVSIITGTATFFSFADDGSVSDSDFAAAPPDFRPPASPAPATSA